MATENDGSGDAAWEEHFHPRRSDHARSESTRLPPRRHRDGLDYRRPVMHSPGDNVVIDLTEDPDSPPPRSMRFRGRLDSPPPIRPLRFPLDLMNHTSTLADNPTVIDLEAETTGDSVDVSPNSGDVQIVGSSSVRPRPIEPRYLDNNGIPLHFRPLIQSTRASEHGQSRRVVPGRSYFRTEEDLLSFMSDTLQYGVSALDYNPPSQPAHRPRRSSYKALSPAPEGFTRLLAEDDVPLCPNCHDELGTGEGLKQQIHIAKACGHVSIVYLELMKSYTKTNGFVRSIVASALGIGPSQSLKRHLQRQSRSQSARLQVAINL